MPIAGHAAPPCILEAEDEDKRRPLGAARMLR
jgi:hypothetical protein